MNLSNCNLINFGHQYNYFDDYMVDDNESDKELNTKKSDNIDFFRMDELLRPDETENYQYFGYDSDDLPLASSISTALRAKVLPYDYAPRSVINANNEFDDEQKHKPFFRYCKLRRSDGFYKPSHVLFDIATRLNDNTDKWGEDEKDIMTHLKRYDERYEKQYISRSKFQNALHLLHLGATNNEVLKSLKDLEKNNHETVKKIHDKYTQDGFYDEFNKYCNKYKDDFYPPKEDDFDDDDYINK